MKARKTNNKVKDKMKIYELNNTSLITLGYVYSGDKYKVNGLPLNELEKTYLNDWYKVDGVIESVVEVSTERINERWELKNKNLYNEKIPMLIDEHTKEKYEDIIEDNLYEYKYDTNEIEKTIELCEIVHINDDVPFMETTSKITNYDRHGNKGHYKPFLIDKVAHHKVDMCLYPKPLLNLTRPVLITPQDMFIVLFDYIYSLGNNKYRIVSIDDSVFKVKRDNGRYSNIIYRAEHYTHNSGSANAFKENIYAQNYSSLIKKIKVLGKKIDKFLEKANAKGIEDAIYQFREENSYPKKNV